MNNDKLKEWFLSLDKIAQLQEIKKMSIRLCSLKKSLDKAIKSELEYGFNRIGIRGGKFTSLNAKSDNCARMYFQCQEDFKFIVRLL